MTQTRLIIHRTSVSLADDIDAPHEMSIELHAEPFSQTLARIVELNYLPRIAGGLATWILETNETPRRSLAVVAQQWTKPRILVEDSAAIWDSLDFSITPHLWFTYAGQSDPQEIYDRLVREE